MNKNDRDAWAMGGFRFLINLLFVILSIYGTKIVVFFHETIRREPTSNGIGYIF